MSDNNQNQESFGATGSSNSVPSSPILGPSGSTGSTGSSGPSGSNNNTGPNTSNISNNDDFTNLTLNETINGDGFIVTNQQGTTVNGNEKTNTTFNTVDNDNNPDNNTVTIDQTLVETVITGYDNSSVTGQLVAQIRECAIEIKCADFHGKGSIEDYSALFAAANKIANETRQMSLDVDITGFNEFSAAADQLSALFTSFTERLSTINIIDDSVFLQAVLNALRKIVNLSNVFGKFKETILITSTVRIPKSSHDVSVLLNEVMGEINCAMGYINNFVTPDLSLPAAQLSTTDKNIIVQAVNTIENWKVLCDQGVSIALANSPDIQCIKSVNTNLKQKTGLLTAATNALRAKFAILNP
jgi:hypothetical protein